MTRSPQTQNVFEFWGLKNSLISAVSKWWLFYDMSLGTKFCKETKIRVAKSRRREGREEKEGKDSHLSHFLPLTPETH